MGFLKRFLLLGFPENPHGLPGFIPKTLLGFFRKYLRVFFSRNPTAIILEILWKLDLVIPLILFRNPSDSLVNLPGTFTEISSELSWKYFQDSSKVVFAILPKMFHRFVRKSKNLLIFFEIFLDY